jgi:AcrR family transcriptional regulator
MGKKATRDFIVEAADQLIYQQGFDHTSFSHIAEKVKISRGNFYHHFKSKDELLDAVICLRKANTQIKLNKWEAEGEQPFDRIKSFVDILLVNRNKIIKFGCPVGTLTSELAKLNHRAQNEANEIFGIFRVWLKDQFILLGHADKADDLAMQLLARTQGVAVLANAFQDQEFINNEIERMYEWLELYS